MYSFLNICHLLQEPTRSAPMIIVTGVGSAKSGQKPVHRISIRIRHKLTTPIIERKSLNFTSFWVNNLLFSVYRFGVIYLGGSSRPSVRPRRAAGGRAAARTARLEPFSPRQSYPLSINTRAKARSPDWALSHSLHCTLYDAKHGSAGHKHTRPPTQPAACRMSASAAGTAPGGRLMVEG